MDSYKTFIDEFARLMDEGQRLPLGSFEPPSHSQIPENAPKVMIFSPHPDDECIVGGLPFRLRHECQWRVINVAVTQGSNKARQAERRREVESACRFLGFELLATQPNGLEKISLTSRRQNRPLWEHAIQIISGILSEYQPDLILFPHETDRNSTHMGTHALLIDSLEQLPPTFSCHVAETEFWEPMPTPNIMVESSKDNVANLVTALSFHVGEVKRNPYHLRMPAWLMDNVRRGAEHVGPQGSSMPDYNFATLYRLSGWHQGQFHQVLPDGRFLSQTDSPAALLP